MNLINVGGEIAGPLPSFCAALDTSSVGVLKGPVVPNGLSLGSLIRNHCVGIFNSYC